MNWIELLLNLLFSAIGTLFICMAGFVLALLFWRILKVKADREHSVRVENKGNCRSIYYLEVKSLEPSLSFTLLFNKRPLAAVVLPDESDDVDDSQTESNASQKPQPVENKQASASSSGVGAASKAGQSVASVAGKSAGFLGEVGNLLPGSMGNKMKAQSSAARNVQNSALRAGRAPQTISRQVNRVSGSKGQTQSAGRGLSVSSGRQSASVVTSDTSYYVQTPVVEPGQTLDLVLRIGTIMKRYPRGSFPYSIEILPVAIDFPEQMTDPSLQMGTAHFKPVGGWRYFMPAFSTIMLTLMTLTALVILYRFIWF